MRPDMRLPSPSDDLCLRYASGALDPALRLMIEAHLAHDPSTRARVEGFTRLGAAMLAAEAPAALSPGLLARTLDLLPHAGPAPAPNPPGPSLEGLRWRWAGPGCRLAALPVEGSALKTFAFRVGPGRAMLEHGHQGPEWTLVLEGAYSDEGGLFPAGAFVENDRATTHRPLADAREGCVCLIAMAAPLEATGLVGAFARWAMR